MQVSGLDERRKARRIAGRATSGQALTELALLAPVIAIMLLGIVELASAVGAKMDLQAATAQGARIGAIEGNAGVSCMPPATTTVPTTNTVDMDMVNAITSTRGINPNNIQQIQIYKADPNGAPIGNYINTYTRSSTPAFVTPTTFNWPFCLRSMGDPADSLGVHVTYTYHPPISLPGFSTITMDDQTVQRINPNKSYNPCPVPGMPISMTATMVDPTHDAIDWSMPPGASPSYYNIYSDITTVNGSQFGGTPSYSGTFTQASDGSITATVPITTDAPTFYQVAGVNSCNEGERSISMGDARSIAQVTGSAITNTTPMTVNLTSVGAEDWAHWGSSAPDRKSLVTPSLISNYSLIGATSTGTYSGTASGYPMRFAWSDGVAPTTTVTGTGAGVDTTGSGRGFQITVPASTTQQTLLVYVGVLKAKGQLTAQLSDGATPAYTDASLNNPSTSTAPTFAVYTLHFTSGSPGQTLTVTFTEAAANGSGNYASLQAAALQAG
jgi:Flp pilus assembly protein TadG